MSETWIVNASPLIVLAKAGRLSLIEGLCNNVYVPDAVRKEVMAGPTDDPARLALVAGWGRQADSLHSPASLVEWGLGAGETAVLALALQHRPCTALLDDAAARAAARTLGVPTLGTLAVVVRAKIRGLIPSAAQVIHEIRQAGLYVSDRVVTDALRRIDEEWQEKVQ